MQLLSSFLDFGYTNRAPIHRHVALDLLLHVARALIALHAAGHSHGALRPESFGYQAVRSDNSLFRVVFADLPDHVFLSQGSQNGKNREQSSGGYANRADHVLGTSYIAPEVATGGMVHVSSAADAWSMGLLTLEVFNVKRYF